MTTAELIEIHHAAQMVAERAVSSQWVEGIARDVHVKALHEHFQKLAAQMGYSVAPLEPKALKPLPPLPTIRAA
jgi:hypothetical protein